MKIILLLALVVTGLMLVVATGCATSKLKSTETLLTEAGFKSVPATTPQQHQQLESLPVGQVSPVQRNGQTSFVYPDRPAQRLFVGQEADYRNYQTLMRKQLAAEDARLERAARAENQAVDRALSDRDSTPGFEGPGGFDF
jgi:hypothetical protein